MRMHASWFGSQRPTGYKVAARTPRAATASSPRTRHPDHTERAAVLGSIKARPGNDGACGQRRAMADLDSPCARRPPTHVGRGEETGFQVEQRNWYQGSGECREIVLDFESPIQGRDRGQIASRPRPKGASGLGWRCVKKNAVREYFWSASEIPLPQWYSPPWRQY